MKKYVIILIMIIVVALGGIFIFKNLNNENNKGKNTLIIGLDDSFPPMGFRSETNELVGFDIDLAKKVGEKLNMEIKFQPISWASKEQELNSGNIDCIWNGFAYTKERAEIMTLSKPYIKGENYFILKNCNISNQEELVGKKIGVQSGSSQEAVLENSEFGKEISIVPYNDNLTAFMDLETGGIDAIFCSNIIGNYLIESKSKNYKTINSKDISVSEGSVVAFKKGNNDLCNKIENALYELENEGILEQISIKWFGKNMIVIKEN